MFNYDKNSHFYSGAYMDEKRKPPEKVRANK